MNCMKDAGIQKASPILIYDIALISFLKETPLACPASQYETLQRIWILLHGHHTSDQCSNNNQPNPKARDSFVNYRKWNGQWGTRMKKPMIAPRPKSPSIKSDELFLMVHIKVSFLSYLGSLFTNKNASYRSNSYFFHFIPLNVHLEYHSLIRFLREFVLIPPNQLISHQHQEFFHLYAAFLLNWWLNPKKTPLWALALIDWTAISSLSSTLLALSSLKRSHQTISTIPMITMKTKNPSGGWDHDL